MRAECWGRSRGRWGRERVETICHGVLVGVGAETKDQGQVEVGVIVVMVRKAEEGVVIPIVIPYYSK
jgi:hypothetical protein